MLREALGVGHHVLADLGCEVVQTALTANDFTVGKCIADWDVARQWARAQRVIGS
ncbi:hypothetical protein ABZ835_46570 [Streptomyces sp. NPDC047461]|uniref:hypothetical protein n=1 Tax=Streptomyces sp. NPDC047461 TaxID=3155619 RepID=UPI0034102AB3